jgi:hypothetical protein
MGVTGQHSIVYTNRYTLYLMSWCSHSIAQLQSFELCQYEASVVPVV